MGINLYSQNNAGSFVHPHKDPEDEMIPGAVYCGLQLPQIGRNYKIYPRWTSMVRNRMPTVL